ncbi:rho GTPase-activating protein 7-like isoform X2 [Wolffia australiana]
MTSSPGGAPLERPRPAGVNTVFKSGPLFISSKGIGWKSWRKRWFILTRTSLVFFKNDPSALPQRGGEVNLTLGGIDLNNSGRFACLCFLKNSVQVNILFLHTHLLFHSVVVREDKKLLTVLFPDGRDGRAFTLKADTSEDLFEWKSALELALAQAPNAALVMGHNGIFRSENSDLFDGSVQQWRDKRALKSLVVGRPILLALEDIDGGPSFLEKALCFLEKYGTNTEGILRQAADVEEVDRRIQEYEQGRTEFTPDEDVHVIGDCVKHFLRELPSSPVPASCCTALLDALKIEGKEARVNALRSAISESFPEPNRRLLQRILKMMHILAAPTANNRMTPSAVATCMAPLLLRPLLAGECELEEDFDANGDASAQLLAAANAANNAQAIATTLIEEYESIFDSDGLHRCAISAGSRVEESGSDESSDDGNLDFKGDGFHDAENDVDIEVDEDPERILSGKLSESSGYAGSDLYDYKGFGGDSEGESPRRSQPRGLDTLGASPGQPSDRESSQKAPEKNANCVDILESPMSMGDILSSMESGLRGEKPSNRSNGSSAHLKRPNFWGRNIAWKKHSVDSVDSSEEEELAIQRLEITKNDLLNRIAKEAKGNAILQASLERRKQALHERRLALEQDVARLQEQLQAERDLRAALEVGLSISSGQFTSSRNMDSKTRAELEEIALAEADVARLKQKVSELHIQLNQHRQSHYGSLPENGDHLQNVQPRILQQDFDMSLAFCNHEKKQRNDAPSVGKQFSRKMSFDSQSSTDSKAMEASTSMNPEAVDHDVTRPPSVASATLVELTARLDFFKERRSQLMKQLHNLDVGHTGSPHGLRFKASPPWASPR